MSVRSDGSVLSEPAAGHSFIQPIRWQSVECGKTGIVRHLWHFDNRQTGYDNTRSTLLCSCPRSVFHVIIVYAYMFEYCSCSVLFVNLSAID